MKKKGFTLIELLVVIAIIGILSSVVVVSLNSARAKARDAKRVADLGEVKKALTLYFDTNQNYPDTLSGLIPVYLQTLPVPPTGTEVYNYTPSADSLSYHLGATLEQVLPNSGVLASDRDCTSVEGATANLCFDAGVAGGFDGTLDLVYDVTP